MREDKPRVLQSSAQKKIYHYLSTIKNFRCILPGELCEILRVDGGAVLLLLPRLAGGRLQHRVQDRAQAGHGALQATVDNSAVDQDLPGRTGGAA